MYGRYSDRKVFPHYITYYSKMNFLEREIRYVAGQVEQQTRRADKRVNKINEGISEIVRKCQKLENQFNESKKMRLYERQLLEREMGVQQQNYVKRNRRMVTEYTPNRMKYNPEHIDQKTKIETKYKNDSTDVKSKRKLTVSFT